MYNEAKLLSWLSAPENHLYIVNYQNEPKGYLGLSYEPDRLWLDKIYIHPKLQGRGLGAAVLSRVERMATDANISRVALRVNRRNEKAIAFYLRKGFTIDGEADFPAPGGYIYDDYLMSKVIS
jgi:GNAT superfamily N-acetyltransferase